ncbi:EcsC family protein [Bacillus sp. 03113]|uniref:EcsC family protein n=1 Tax=Bacillus sp. 03113 TaxID=2578211 RepID=UPI001143442B|nr:EcsC family protein [Bacillus sp. 03113]
MNDYKVKIHHEVLDWKRKLLRKSSYFNRISRSVQTKVNQYIPEKAHMVMTSAIKNMVEAILKGSNYITKKNQANEFQTLAEKDAKVVEKLAIYRKTAMLEGAGTGAGGFLLGLADFPLLLSIKIKFLFEMASVYGFDTNKYEERIFILQIFHLAFSSEKKRNEIIDTIENWESEKKKLVQMDWREFQQEYRDYIDLIKMFQLVPGVGAMVGAYANYRFLDHLGETAMNCYRLRLLTAAP